MNITVTGRQFEITPSIREYVEKHIETLLEDKALNVTSVNVVMDREKNRFKSSIVVNCKYHVVQAEVVRGGAAEDRLSAYDAPGEDSRSSGAADA